MQEDVLKTKPIYVEIEVADSIERLWEHTQNPDLHNRWDLRFSRIEYLPRREEEEAQRFLYETRIGFGLRIAGEGETTANVERAGNRISALKFWSDDPKSLIRRGNGFWKYFAEPGRVRFLTRYDYEVRFGAPGRLLDRLVFRPMMEWATAWSFDRLRLWLEKGRDPTSSYLLVASNIAVRLGLAFAWIYQGLVPKLLFPQTGETELLVRAGFSGESAIILILLIGFLQVLFGACFLLPPCPRVLYLVSCLALVPLAGAAALAEPIVFLEPFNPSALTAVMLALGFVGYLTAMDLPSARRCRRQPRKEQSP